MELIVDSNDCSLYFPISRTSNQPDKFGTGPFLRWIWVQSRGTDTPGGSKNDSNPALFS